MAHTTCSRCRNCPHNLDSYRNNEYFASSWHAVESTGCAVKLRSCGVVFQSKVSVTRSKRQFHRIFRLSNQLYIYQPDLCAFLPLDDMPSDLPQQLWSAVTALKGIDNGRTRCSQQCPQPLRCHSNGMMSAARHQCQWSSVKFNKHHVTRFEILSAVLTIVYLSCRAVMHGSAAT